VDYGVFGMIVLILTKKKKFDLPCSAPFELEKTSYTSLRGIYVCVF
jgi:hypothetical protein